MWIDFMKFGVLPASDLNNLVTLIKKGLGALPQNACCFAIGPTSCSQRRSGIREELRRGLSIIGNKSHYIVVVQPGSLYYIKLEPEISNMLVVG